MSQLRSLDFAWIQYVSDSRNALYYYPGNNNAAFDKFWMAIVERYTSNVDKLRVCPEATQLSEVVWGTASVSWSGKNHPAGYWIHNSAGDYHYGSYAINGWLYNNYVAGESYLSWLEPGVQTSNAPAFLDSAWVDIWPRDTDVPAANIEDPYNGGNWGAGMVRATINRHNLAINISFIDGSTRLVPLGDLWTLAWSRKFRPGFYQPPPFQ
ncbi:MAG: hypothetical protein GC162_04650 [Planctomycetes bacterium]|nr:hypothetical protein [Planctomycetota bacterium]